MDAASPPPLPMLEKRRIEAAVLKNVYDVLVERLGKEAAQEVIGAAVIQSAVDQGEEFRQQQSGTPDLAAFSALSAQWSSGGAMEATPLRATAEHLDYDVTHCAYAEMYRDMGLAEIGHLLSCNRDQTFIQGFNPDIELTVSQTIMQGADYCDFRYRMTDQKED